MEAGKRSGRAYGFSARYCWPFVAALLVLTTCFGARQLLQKRPELGGMALAKSYAVEEEKPSAGHGGHRQRRPATM